MTTINAFHPDYVRTYEPKLLASVRLEAVQVANGKINGAKTSRAVRETVDVKQVANLAVFPKTQVRQR